MIKFTSFLGIDQTGATDSKGNPKPLPAALIYKSGSKWRLEFSRSQSRLQIPRLTKENLKSFLREFPLPGPDLSKTGLVLDSVFGLPKETWPRTRKTKSGGSDGLFALFQQAADFEYKEKSFGRDVAEAFFAQFLPSGKFHPLPQRLCEVRSGANSVFLTRPFQRNIGCGTFRIWKDLGSSEEKWFQIWAFDKPTSRLHEDPWIFEAYPTLFWKKILGFPARNATSLTGWLKSSAPEDLMFDPKQLPWLLDDADLCDSVVLALGAWILQARGQIWKIPTFPSLSKEGWILGLPL